MKYIFIIISNTTGSDQSHMHCWSILDIHPINAVFVFYSFGILRLKMCIIWNNSKIFYKMLFGLEKFWWMSDDKITAVELRFSCAAFENLSGKKRLKLSENTQGLLSFLNQFALSINLLCKVKSAMTLWLILPRI